MANNSLLINQGTNSSVNFDSNGGTFTQVVGIGYGTVSTIGTLPNLPGGSIVVTAATISSLPNIPGGSVVQTAGTVNTGTINTGTINLGTVVGKDANAAAQTGNPVTTGGTDSGGTVYTLRLDTKGQQFIGGGTVDTLTTVANLTNGSVRITVGTITVLPNLPQGSINVTAGTIATLGTMGTLGLVNTVTTVSNLSNGSIKVTAGTVDTLGTMGTLGLVNTVTTVSNLSNGSIKVTAGTVNTGTINTGTINAGTVTLANVAGLLPLAAADGDSIGNPTTTRINGDNYLYNEISWNRQRGNVSLTNLSSSLRTIGTTTQSDQVNYNQRGLMLITSVTVVNAGTIIPRIEGKTNSGVYYTVMIAGTYTSVGTYMSWMYPGLTNVAPVANTNSGTSMTLPQVYRIVVPQTNGSVTYANDWELIV